MRETTDLKAGSVGRRLPWLDIAKGIALLAMASYHFLWDLSMFGYLDPGTPATGWPRIYARSIASTFLFLSGFSLVLAHGNGIRWNRFWYRLATIVGSAALVTAAFYFFVPEGLVFFGILHAMAAASLIGLLFLRPPPAITILVAGAAFAAPHYLSSEMFNHPALWWIGLSTETRQSFDYVPLLPWLCPFLLGIAAGRIERISGWLRQNAPVEKRPNWVTRPLSFLGRHTLVFYLVHQPVLMAILYGVTLVHPAPVVPPEVRESRSCQAQCVKVRDEAFCKRFCGCVVDELTRRNLMIPLQSGAISVENNEALGRISTECTIGAESP
jgi:uncharacterized membrane protein